MGKKFFEKINEKETPHNKSSDQEPKAEKENQPHVRGITARCRDQPCPVLPRQLRHFSTTYLRVRERLLQQDLLRVYGSAPGLSFFHVCSVFT